MKTHTCRREHIVITECTALSTPDELEEMLGDLFVIFTFTWGPENMGYWINRKRRFCVLLLRIAHGGLFNAIGDFDLFKQLFAAERSGNTKGDVYWMAEDSDIQQALAADQQRLDIANPEDLMIGSYTTRRVMYMRDYLSKKADIPQEDLNVPYDELDALFRRVLADNNEVAIADLHQSPPTYRITEHVPCLIGHGFIWSWTHNRLLIPDELMVAQGWPLLGTGEQPWGHVWQSLPNPVKVRMAGNTIHVHVITAILCWVIATAWDDNSESKDVCEGGSSGSQQSHPSKRRRS